jgi:F-type H+-transporting ATPase subunit delta
MDITIISKRYAKALFDLALELNRLEKIKQDIELVGTVTKENPEFNRLLKNPIIEAGKKTQVLKGIFQNNVDELTIRFFRLLTRKERAVYLEHICQIFIKLYKEYNNIITVTLTAPVKLEKKMVNRLLKLFEDKTHKTIELIEVEDKTMMGGFIISMDDMKFDASLKNKITELSQVFDINLYIREI